MGAAALNDVSLTVHDQEFMVLLGPSGCGKTTLLRLIAGFEQPDAGAILIDGRDVTDVPGRRGLAMVFQSYALYPHMTVSTTCFRLKMHRVAASRFERRCRTWPARSGYADWSCGDRIEAAVAASASGSPWTGPGLRPRGDS